MRKKFLGAALALAIGFVSPWAAAAGNTIKVGIVAEMSGPFADFGMQITNGARAYMKQHGDTVAGKKIELIIKDATSPEVAKRLAQELVVKDEVDFIAGFGLTPNAMAVAPVATEAKKPTIVMNAAASAVTTKSPYIVRTSFSLPQVAAPLAQWAYKSGVRQVYTVVTDYAPGHDSEAAFKKAFTSLGGQVVGEARMPLKNPEFAPFVQKVKDAKPQAVFVFVPAGEQSVGFMKAYRERELSKAGIKLIGTGDLTEDGVIEAIGDNALGVITTQHYSAAHKSPENDAFLKAYAQVAPQQRPNFMGVGAYDGMAMIYEVVRKLNGNIDGDKAMDVLKSMKMTSPRGPIQIDPETRDIVQTIYVREVKKVGGKLYNVEFDQFPAVKDPAK